MGKVVIPARLDELVNVVCPLYHDAFIRKRIGINYCTLVCIMYAIQSMKVRRCSEISYLL